MKRKEAKKSFRLVKDVRLSWETKLTQSAEFVAYCNDENEARQILGQLGEELPWLNAWLTCGSDLEQLYRLEPNRKVAVSAAAVSTS